MTPESASRGRRIGAVVFTLGLVGVAGIVVAVVLGWRLIGSPIEQLDRLSAATSDALVTLANDVTFVRDTIVQVQGSLDATGELLGDSAESVNQIEIGLSDTADALQGAVPDSISAIEQDLTEVIATTSVLEPTLRSLAFLGVEYEPEVPLTETLQGLRATLRPLPGQLRADGQLIGSLTGEIESLSGHLSELATAVDGIADDLAEAESRLTEEAVSAEAARAAIDTERARLPLLERRARVVLVILGAAIGITQLALAASGWAHWRGTVEP